MDTKECISLKLEMCIVRGKKWSKVVERFYTNEEMAERVLFKCLSNFAKDGFHMGEVSESMCKRMVRDGGSITFEKDQLYALFVTRESLNQDMYRLFCRSCKLRYANLRMSFLSFDLDFDAPPYTSPFSK